MGDFLKQLQDSITRLDGLNTGITDTLRKRETFTDNVLRNLTEIKNQVLALVGTMNNLRDRILGLEKEISDNSGSIGTNQKRIQDLTEENRQLQTQLANLQGQYNTEKTNLETQIANLQTNNQRLQQELDALKAEINTKGNQQQQDHLKVIADLEAKCKAETDANNAQIQTLNQQLAECNQKIEAAKVDYATLQTQIQHNTEQINNLTAEVTRLTDLNNNLEGSVKNAIAALNSASDKVNQLLASRPNDMDQDNIIGLLTEITQSIQKINASIPPPRAIPPSPGSGPGPAASSSSSAAASSSVPPIGPPSASPPPASPSISIGGTNYLVSELVPKLRGKSAQVRVPGNKYDQAIQAILDARHSDPNLTDPTNIRNIQNKFVGITLQPDGASFKIKGGNKTKKIRKQKGGYVYKNKKGGYIIRTKITKTRSRSSSGTKRRSSRKSSSSVRKSSSSVRKSSSSI